FPSREVSSRYRGPQRRAAPPSRLPPFTSFAFSISAIRSLSSDARPARSSARSKYLRPSIQVCSATAYGDSGLALQSTKSASFPTSSEPTRCSTLSDRAGLAVTNLNASTGGTPPYFTALADSVLRRRASSLSSELKPVFTPRLQVR